MCQLCRGLTIMKRQDFADLFLFAVLALVMLATRTHSLSQMIHLPDTGDASFFVAGYVLRRRLAFPALVLLAFAIDWVVVRQMGGQDGCFTIAYGTLVAAYGVMWAAGRLARTRLEPEPGTIPVLALVVCGATFLAEILSSGGFYVLSGYFPHPTLAGFAGRLWLYAPFSLFATLGWTACYALGHAIVLLAAPIPAGLPERDA